MKGKLGVLGMVLIFLSLLAWAGHANAQKTSTNTEKKVWEYKVGAAMVNGTPSVQDELNQLGAEGWELVAVENVGSTTPPAAIYYLKRAKE